MNGADYHAMGRASMALTDGKNELIRAGCGSELTIRLMRDAAESLERQMEQHKETVEAVAKFMPAQT